MSIYFCGKAIINQLQQCTFQRCFHSIRCLLINMNTNEFTGFQFQWTCSNYEFCNKTHLPAMQRKGQKKNIDCIKANMYQQSRPNLVKICLIYANYFSHSTTKAMLERASFSLETSELLSFRSSSYPTLSPALSKKIYSNIKRSLLVNG